MRQPMQGLRFAMFVTAAAMWSCGDPAATTKCGDGVVGAGEICDGASCPTSCDDSNACTIDTLSGSADTCNAVCSHVPISQCKDSDGCCPAGCNSATDNDCMTKCGNGVVDPQEKCD